MLLDEALRWGVACGAAAASLGGTGVGSFDLVKRLSTQATVMNIMKIAPVINNQEKQCLTQSKK
jgi:hypothetical protein